jgi:hypothetical protein
MYASASTWLYNVVRMLNASDTSISLQTHFFGARSDFAGFDKHGVTNIVKSHEIEQDAAISELARRSEKIIVTIRDPRDAVASLMLYHRYEFSRALSHVTDAARLCVTFGNEVRALLLAYETGFFDERATLDLIAKHLALQIEARRLDEIFDASRRPEVEKFISRLGQLPGALQDRVSGDMLDPTTHWHSYHAGRTGEIGRWKKMLTESQVAEVQGKLSDCFRFESV